MLRGANTVLYQHRAAPVWRETTWSSAPHGAGRQEAAALPPLHPHISPGSLQAPWKRGAAGLSLPAFCPKKCRKKGFPHSKC